MRGVIFLFSLATVVGSISSSTHSDSLVPDNGSSSKDVDDESDADSPDSSELPQSGQSSDDSMSSASGGTGQSSEGGFHGSSPTTAVSEPHSPTILDSPSAPVHHYHSSKAGHYTHNHVDHHRSRPALVHPSSKTGHLTDMNGDKHPIAARERDDFTGSDERAQLEEELTNSDDSEPIDPAAGVVKQLLNHLFGEAIDSFSTSGSLAKLHGSMTVDCTSPSEDGDANFNIVTTLCPFLRSEGSCGRLRHPTYEVADEEAICSTQCRPHINDLIRALPNRQSLSHKHEGVIFRDVVNEILRQYCSICRTGCIL
jgi:hypothetical protein